MTGVELAPCPECGSECSIQTFAGKHIIGQVQLWMCSNDPKLGGECRMQVGFLSAEEWNANATPIEADEVERDQDWFKRHADRRNAFAFILKDPAYFAEECAAAIMNGTLRRSDADAGRGERKAPFAKGVEHYPVAGYVWKRTSTDEWVLEISGEINDCSFICRHTEPLTTAPEDVAGLPTRYADHPAPDQGEVERLRRQIIRLREEANLDDRASESSTNPDAAPVFASWAISKRQFADDIERLLAALRTPDGDTSGEKAGG